jgi:hypothetical protein
MLRRTAIAAAFLALAVPAPASAVPVPMEGCAPEVAAPGARPCLPVHDGEGSALAAAARSGAKAVVEFWNTASFVLF